MTSQHPSRCCCVPDIPPVLGSACLCAPALITPKAKPRDTYSRYNTHQVSIFNYIGSSYKLVRPSLEQRTAAVCKRGNVVNGCKTTHSALGWKDATTTRCCCPRHVREYSALGEDPESGTLALAGGSTMDTETSGNCFVCR